MTDEFQRALGDRVHRVLSLWEQSTNRKVEPAGEPLGGGRSGARLFPVRIADNGLLQAAILKYCPPEPDGPAREPGAHDRAMRSSPPGFAADHLVDRLYDPIVLEDGSMLLFLRVASGSLTEQTALRTYRDHEAIGPALREITRSVLADWNTAPDHGTLRLAHVSPGEFLTRTLAHRLQPGHALTRWLAGQPDISHAPGLYLAMQRFEYALVNPMALVRNRDVVARLRVPMTTGLAHGDLHIDNIIVPRLPGDPTAFRLIDLTTFDEAAPLARDPMHLLLSVCGLHLSALDATARARLIQALVKDEPDPRLPAPLTGAIDAVRLGGADAYAAGDRTDDWHVERMLALVAGALMFVGREPPGSEAAWWYFTVAAQAATRFLAGTAGSASRPTTPPTPVVVPPAPPEHRPAPPVRRSPLAEKEQLLAAILAALGPNGSVRLDHIIALLPDRIPPALTHYGSDSLRDRVNNLVAVLDRPHADDDDPWSTLVEATRLIIGSDRAVEQLAEVVHRLRT
jgi:hypothetical protein